LNRVGNVRQRFLGFLFEPEQLLFHSVQNQDG
jgi:hypothetical protein